MKITVRLIVSLVLTVAVVAVFSAYWQTLSERQRLHDEMVRRSALLADGLQDSIRPLLAKGTGHQLARLVERFGNRERLAGVAVYGPEGDVRAASKELAGSLGEVPSVVQVALLEKRESGSFIGMGERRRHLFAVPILSEDALNGVLLIVHTAQFVDAQIRRVWRATFLRVLAQAFFITAVVLFIIRWSVMGPIARMAEWMKSLRAGESTGAAHTVGEDLFAPIAREVTRFASHLSQAKQAVQVEARLRQTAEALWTPDRLKEHVKLKLSGKPLFVVSNREPYMHYRKGRSVEWLVPAGGLVTALEPVLRATGGTWIAHGAGDADLETVDEQGRLRVPPDDPHYTLRRVMLTKEEENGYYYGFSNEGLWPLCHIAHTRPLFRAQDWEQYQSANRKFADAILDEMRDVRDPCLLVQDYHFALLPRLIKNSRPDARVALFWHIPWPNPEAFAICPWQRSLLDGMLGADLVGFHTQFHCNNFLETVDRTLESRISWERFTVGREGHDTLVKPFPISVAFQEPGPGPAPGPDRAALLKDIGVKSEFIAVGVERMDYTKGVLEKLLAVDRFLEKNPDYAGRFTYIQIGAPSRTHIKRYHDFLAEVEAEAERINWKYKRRDWRPVMFLKRHHNHAEILPYYRHADVCLVASLHDGMNLVAKEFVAAREGGGGVLILSRFAGASRELRDALLVNPYDVEQMADAIRLALEMPAEEKAERLSRLREVVRERNIYRWAGELIEELTRVRLDTTPPVPTGGGAEVSPLA